MEVRVYPYNNNYSISNNGCVWSKRNQRWLKPTKGNHGYYTVNLGGGVKSVHRLVLETFVGPCPEGKETRHLNSNKADNRLENLCWGTRSENQLDAVRHGTHSFIVHKPSAKLTETDVRMIIYMYRTGLFTQKEIAKIYNVTRGNIGYIVNKKSWRYLWK